jgi:poly-gamma-glutamate synthesis protein (capsule biosynthesis protein)
MAKWCLSPFLVLVGCAFDRGPSADRAAVIFVGDILLGDHSQPMLDERGYLAPFAHLRELLGAADARIGNLEGPITERSRLLWPDKRVIYRQAPAAAGALAEIGFDVVVLANNHALDYGVDGLVDTQRLLAARGIAAIGAGRDQADARRGLLLHFGDGLVLGVLAYVQLYAPYAAHGWYAGADQPGCAAARPAEVAEDVRRLRGQADAVVVQFHFGHNYRPVIGAQRRLARAAIDAGADVVIGHHPHVVQPVEVYRGRPIFYSIGNFTFGSFGRFEEFELPALGLVVRLIMGRGRPLELEVAGIAVDNRKVEFAPRPLTAEQRESLLIPILQRKGARFDAARDPWLRLVAAGT